MSRFLIRMIRFYQTRISTHTHASCRFLPTCSEYAVTAIQRFGMWKGLRLAIWRVLRCNPFGKGGYDPVPENTDVSIRRN
ncbi:MAG TPA: membrane protein insertion efficiency factor YidD [Candidatus Limiplasma sp.]|nr:membrane protein insertion efficiency factor YidD [Candidatus Limiplasma sp.]HRX08429.1 membrane protein insertion efficiency factor YidD [Candidatus Limiplasma sp.]